MTRQKQNARQVTVKVTGPPRGSWPTWGSMDAAASALGCPLAAVKGAKRSGCPAFKDGKIHGETLIPFLFAKMREASELPEGFTGWGDVLNMEKSKRERVKRMKDEATVLDYPTAESAAANAEGFYFGELDRAERELPPLLSGMDEMQIASRLKQFMADLRAKSREKFQKVSKP